MSILPQGITRAAGKAVLEAKKNSPHIAFGFGLVGIGAGTFLACRATLDLPAKLDEINHDLDQVKESKERVVEHLGEGAYNEKEYNKDLLYVYFKSGKTMARLYGPAALVMGVSIAALAGSHVQLTRRNAALATAFTAISKAFEDYREKVREEIGVEEERKLFMNAGCGGDGDCCDACKIGGEIEAVSAGPFSPYAKLFGDHNVNHTPDPSTNLFFLRGQQAFLNHRLADKGHVLLNDAYDLLKIPRTTAGALVGWLYNGEEDPTNWIDFGLDGSHAQRFRDGDEASVWLDFNVHGLVYQEIGK